MPALNVARVRFGDLELDLERRQVDHGDERRAFGNVRFLVLAEVRDHAVHRRAHGELGDLAREIFHGEALAVALQAFRSQLEREAVAIEIRVGGGVVVVESGGLEIVGGAAVVAFADHALIPCGLGATLLAVGGGDRDFRKVGLLATLQNLAADFDFLAGEGGVQAVEGCVFAGRIRCEAPGCRAWRAAGLS
ncbi:MAG: hypothetical protein WDO68_28000 [Gammaproteobacteria bacterium]